ncbi:centromere protein P isoform X2 [Petaurus breviceps papuanus]|uniref:centromere protein P isoform X2 n=1 Tax=Petaurus breviceps papuanus TaxID=3040969 RepID=UPI0036DBCCC5
MDREREEQQQELRALRAEIGALRRRLQRMSPAAAPDPAPEAESEPERRFCQGDEPAPAGGGEAQLGRLELGLSFLSQGTGVRIKDYSLTRLELARGSGSGPQDGQRVLRKGHLAGQYHTVPFQLEFQLLETRSEESSSAVVTELSIILEHMEHGELSRFVARTEEKRDLFLFFRSLHFFLEWCEYRRQTFQYFQEKHPTMVQLPGGPAAEVMVLQSPRVPGPDPGQEGGGGACPPLLQDPPGAAGHRGCPREPR